MARYSDADNWPSRFRSNDDSQPRAQGEACVDLPRSYCFLEPIVLLLCDETVAEPHVHPQHDQKDSRREQLALVDHLRSDAHALLQLVARLHA